MLFAIPLAVLLSQCMGVAGCLWPSSDRMRRMILPSRALRNRAPSPAYAADVTTIFSIPQLTKMAPLIKIGCPALGMSPRKKYPPMRLRARDSERYDASEWMLSIIADA